MNSTDFESRKGARTKASKGDVSIVEVAGRLKVSLPRQYFGGQQIKKALGLKATPENWVKAERIARRIADDLQEGKFDDTLDSYGVKSNIKIVSKSDSLPPKPKLGVLEIWEKYLEYKKHNLKATTYHNTFIKTYTSAIEKAVQEVGDNPISIRNWFLSNRCLMVAKSVLVHLSKSYQLLMKQGLITCNPFDGMSDELPRLSKNKEVNTHQADDDSSLYDHREVKKKAFTQGEVKTILDAVKQTKASHYYPLLHFLFLTGSRTNEAISFMWGDVKWENEYIVIQRSYSPTLKSFISTKTGNPRLFPMPKNSALWMLLKSLPQGSSHELVFKSQSGKVVNSVRLSSFWKGSCRNNTSNYPGLITTLVSQGKVSKYLPLYNTRHTFISYQINECGVPPHVVKDWCGHSEKLTTETYRQEDLLTKPVDYNNQPTLKQSSEPSRIEVLEQQVQLLMEQNKMLQEIIVGLETKSKTTEAEPII